MQLYVPNATGEFKPVECYIERKQFRLAVTKSDTMKQEGVSQGISQYRFVEIATYFYRFIVADTVRNIINKHVSSAEKLEAEYVAFGFRRNGVDSNNFIASRLHNYVYDGLKEYTHIFVVEIKDALYYDFKTMYVSLANVDDAIYSVMRDDLDKYYNTDN